MEGSATLEIPSLVYTYFSVSPTAAQHALIFHAELQNWQHNSPPSTVFKRESCGRGDVTLLPPAVISRFQSGSLSFLIRRSSPPHGCGVTVGNLGKQM